MTLRRQQKPHWLWHHKRREAQLCIILKSLQESTEDQITSRRAQHSGMQLNPLDFETGDTAPSITLFFAPRDDNHLLIRKTLSQLQKNNFFRCSLGTGTKYQDKSQRQLNNMLRSALVETFKDYHSIANRSRNVVADLHRYEDDGSFNSAICHNGKQANLRVVTSHELRSENHRMRRNHQVLTISINEHPGALPSITEIQFLVIQIRQAMRAERKLGFFKNPYTRNSQPRMTKYEFPTLVTIIYRGGYVRVIHGYMDGTLRIQYTEPRQVTVNNFESMMEKLLQWSLPEIQGDPTKVVTLPTIQEEEEDSTEQDIQLPRITRLTRQEMNQLNTFLQRCLKSQSNFTHACLYQPFSRNTNHNNVRSKYFFSKCAYNSCMLQRPIACKRNICKTPHSPKPKPNSNFRVLSPDDHLLTPFV
ncbi:uncharacterized protein N7477_008144 [Penicillium maclennaniae]|uniref:uncharacterized protein n=1 Tax=Penicillium maclennaniae TaxID=1343394 RepID=UPI002540BB68|nr:uncharacterized protein N7477_008144 [Penicillium maclennaniae]KAJ5665696.1 hypothetical protein N7477_008144 [Penicillium maclennaniae]